MKKLWKSVITMSLAFVVTFTSVPMDFNVYALAGDEEVESGDETSEPTNAVDEINIGIDSYPDVDILLTKGETMIDAIDFKSAVEQALTEKGLEPEKLHIYAESSSDLQTDGSFSWTQYSGVSNPASGSKNGAGENPLSYNRAGSLRVEDHGTYSNVNFYGNWCSPGSLFALAPVPEPQPGYVVNRQSVTFDYNLNFGDSITGAGYVINAYDAGDGYIRGQMLGLMNSNTSGKGYHFYANGKSCGLYNFALPKSLVCSGANAKGHKVSDFYGVISLISSYQIAYSGSLKIVRHENNISIYTRNGKQTEFAILDTFNIDKIGDRFGYFMFTYSHGCSQTGHFQLTNLSIDTQSRIPFNEVLTNCSSKLIEDDLHFVVNIDDKADDSLSSMQLTSLINADNGYDGLHYIGWGNDDTNGQQMKDLLNNTAVVVSEHEKALLTDADYATGMYFTDDNGVLRRYKGVYLSQQEYDYQFYDLVQKTADYIYNVVLKYMNKNDVVIENPAKLFVDPSSKAYDTAVSPGQYSYGKWTVKHYSKEYEGDDPVNKDLYGRHDLIEVDGDNISSTAIWNHTDKQSKYETQTRIGWFEDVVVGRTSKDEQIYEDKDGTLFKYDYDINGYVNIYTGAPQTPNGEVKGTIKTGEHIETRVVDYKKIVPSTKAPESEDSDVLRTTIDSKTMTHIGTYIVMSDYGEYASNNSWISLPALETSGQAVHAWSLNGITDWSCIQTTEKLEYYVTMDIVPQDGKVYYYYDKNSGYKRFYGSRFKSGITYYENINDVRYYITEDSVRDYDKTYYAKGILREFRPGSGFWSKSDFTKGVTYYEKIDGIYVETKDTDASSFKVYYYFENPDNLYEIGTYDTFITIEGADYNYYECSEDLKYFRTSDSYPQDGKTYYYKSDNTGQYVKFKGSYFSWGRKYYEMYESCKYLVTLDEGCKAGKTYYYKDDDGNYVRFVGMTFEEDVVYYERLLDTSEEADIGYYSITVYNPRKLAIDTLNLKLEDEITQAYRYTGPVISGTITPVTEPFVVTPVEGDNTTEGLNRVFYVIRQQVDGGNAGLTGEYEGTGISDYHVGKFKYWDEDSSQYIDTGYVTFQLMDVYSADEYTSEPVYKDFVIDEFDPLVTTGIPVLGDKEMEYCYDNDLSLYHTTEARVGDESDEVGLFEIFFEDNLLKTIFVHRLPHAKFKLQLGYVQTGETEGEVAGYRTVQYINESFDYDHYYTDFAWDGSTKLPGIVEYLWEYREEGQNWQVGKLTDINNGIIKNDTRYEVRLTVWDREGEFSQTSILIGNGEDPPIAKFSLEGDAVSISNGEKITESDKSITYADYSYDPNGYDLTEYEWTVFYKADGEKNGTEIYKGPDFQTTFSRGPGLYTYYLRVKNAADTWSVNIATDTIKVTKPKRNLIYDKNVESANQYGVTSKRVFTNEYATIDTANNYCRRIGWDFVGWGATNDSQTVYDDTTNRLMMGSEDVTIYGVYKRDLRLTLAEDTIYGIDDVHYDKTIWNHTMQYNYDNVNEGNQGTNRDDVSYVVTYAQNDSPTDESHLVDLGNTDTSTELGTGNTVTATRSLNGWWSSYEGTYGIKLGNPGTTFTVDTTEYAPTMYTVTGDVGSLIMYSKNKQITLYPRWNHAYVKLPDCERNEAKDLVNGQAADKFLGWFTKPQPVDGGSGDGGVFVGVAGDIVEITGDITLYPWFNIAPTISHSAISDGFYEGQPISYDQLLSIVNVYDPDDFTDEAIDNVLKYNGVRNWIDLYRLNASVFLDGVYPTMSDDQKQAIIDGINYDSFTPTITGVTYYCNGTDSNGDLYSDSIERSQTGAELVNTGLLTNPEYVGQIVVHYEITDNGTLSNELLINDSPITVGYDLHSYVCFNHLPTITLKHGYIFAGDPYLTSYNIEDYLLSEQTVSDVEDDVDNAPWWYKDDVPIENPSDDTHKRLVDTLHVVGIYDICFQSGYENEHPDVCESIKQITDIRELFDLKNTDMDSFEHIYSFKVELDCVDQWGKSASMMPFGMTQAERSLQIVNFNNWDDDDLSMSAINERIRYIDSDWTDTLGEHSYWIDSQYGLPMLNSTFENYVNRSGISSTQYSGNIDNSTPDKPNRNVNITVNDFD